MSCTNAQHKQKKKGPCHVCKGCIYCPPRSNECQHKRNKPGRPSTGELPNAQGKQRSRKRPRISDGAVLEDLGQTLKQAREGLDVDGGFYKDCMECLICLLGLPKGKLSAREGSTSASAVYDSALRLQEIFRAVLDMFFKGKPAKHEVMQLLLKRMIEDHDSSATSKQLVSHSKLSTTMLNLLKNCSSDVRSVCLSTLFSAFDRQTANTLLAQHGLPQVGQRAFTNLRNEFRLMERGEAMGVSMRNRTSRMSEEIIMDALHFILSCCNHLGVPRTIIRVGGEQVVIPRIERSVTATYMWKLYRSLPTQRNSMDVSVIANDESGDRGSSVARKTTRLGKGEFFELAKKVTVPPEQSKTQCGEKVMKGGGSGIHTELYREEQSVYATLRRIQENLDKFSEQHEWDNDIFIRMKQIEDCILWCEHFVRHELRNHWDSSSVGCSEGFHCLSYAVGQDCEHDHVFNCADCLRLLNCGQVINQLIDGIDKNSTRTISTLHEIDPSSVDHSTVQQLRIGVRDLEQQLTVLKQGLVQEAWQQARFIDAVEIVKVDNNTKDAVIFITETLFPLPMDHKTRLADLDASNFNSNQSARLITATVIKRNSEVNCEELPAPYFVDFILDSQCDRNTSAVPLVEELLLELSVKHPEIEKVTLVSNIEENLLCSPECIALLGALNVRFESRGIQVSRCMFTLGSFPALVTASHIKRLRKRCQDFLEKGNVIENARGLMKVFCELEGMKNTRFEYILISFDTLDKITNKVFEIIGFEYNSANFLDVQYPGNALTSQHETINFTLLSEVSHSSQGAAADSILQLGEKNLAQLRSLMANTPDQEMVFGCDLPITVSYPALKNSSWSMETFAFQFSQVLLGHDAEEDDSFDALDPEESTSQGENQQATSQETELSQLFRCSKCRRAYRILSYMQEHESKCKGVRSKHKVYISAIRNWALSNMCPLSPSQISLDNLNFVDELISNEWNNHLDNSTVPRAWALSAGSRQYEEESNTGDLDALNADSNSRHIGVELDNYGETMNRHDLESSETQFQDSNLPV